MNGEKNPVVPPKPSSCDGDGFYFMKPFPPILSLPFSLNATTPKYANSIYLLVMGYTTHATQKKMFAGNGKWRQRKMEKKR